MEAQQVGPAAQPPAESFSDTASGGRRHRRAARDEALERRSVLLWGGAALATLVAAIGVVVALNSTVYSASGFVERYLSAIERRDLATALEMPGVTVPAGADTTALTRPGTTALDRTEVVGESSTGSGVTTVEVEWTDGAESGAVTFSVEPGPAIAGIFGNWRFMTTPVAVVDVTVLHSPAFRANGLAVQGTEAVAPDAVALGVAALAPSKLVLDADSTYLAAEKVSVIADGDDDTATVDVQANELFVETVQTELDQFLDTCAAQEVLQPSGCPFGRFVEDRLLAPPTWSMVDYPAIAVQPGDTVGLWTVPATPGVAHITAEVISLFDGTQSTLDEDVPFSVLYRIELDESGSLRIVPAA